MGMAALSPCPLLVHSTYGTVVIVRLFILLRELTVYVKEHFRHHALSCTLPIKEGTTHVSNSVVPVIKVCNVTASFQNAMSV